MSILRLQEISLALNLEEGDVPFILGALGDGDPDVTRTATDVAAEYIVMGFQQLRDGVIDLLDSTEASSNARVGAALALGPALETCSVEGYEDEFGDTPLTKDQFDRVISTLQNIHTDRGADDLLRRKALEAAVRAGEPAWLEDAVRAAFNHDEPEWLHTAIFCSTYIGADFTSDVVNALRSSDEDIVHAAVFAAADITVPRDGLTILARVANDASAPLPVRCGAIESLGAQGTDEAREPLYTLMNDANEVIADAANEALSDPAMGMDMASLEADLDDLPDLGDF